MGPKATPRESKNRPLLPGSRSSTTTRYNTAKPGQSPRDGAADDGGLTILKTRMDKQEAVIRGLEAELELLRNKSANATETSRENEDTQHGSDEEAALHVQVESLKARLEACFQELNNMDEPSERARQEEVRSLLQQIEDFAREVNPSGTHDQSRSMISLRSEHGASNTPTHSSEGDTGYPAMVGVMRILEPQFNKVENILGRVKFSVELNRLRDPKMSTMVREIEKLIADAKRLYEALQTICTVGRELGVPQVVPLEIGSALLKKLHDALQQVLSFSDAGIAAGNASMEQQQ